jgi:type II secretory pathway pseudopilin PulG
MLIVVILLGILATLIIPQISVSTGEAKLNTLRSNLNTMRNAVELYYRQHNETYPGEKKIDGSAASDDANESREAFIDQLTQYTSVAGDANVSKTGTHIYGPYLKSKALPTNPYNNLNTVLCDITTTDITARSSNNTTGWKFYIKTGVFMANDGANDNI